ncbi:MAG: AEC family transporter [Lachnospiraceae bacterium]
MIIIFLLILIGYFIEKKHMLSRHAGKDLSVLVLQITNPALLIMSVLESDTTISRMQLLVAAIISIVLFVVLILLGRVLPILLRAPQEQHLTYNLMTMFGNVAFIGIPVVSAVLGSEAMLYVVVFNLVFALVVYTYGYFILEEGQKKRQGFQIRKLINPGTVAGVVCILLFLLKPPVPRVLADTIGYVGKGTTFICMLIIGFSLARMPLKSVFNEARLYVFIALRYVLLPVAAAFLLRLLISDAMLRAVMVLMLAMPVANMPLMMMEEVGNETALMSKGIVLSTICSLITVTVVAAFL